MNKHFVNEQLLQQRLDALKSLSQTVFYNGLASDKVLGVRYNREVSKIATYILNDQLDLAFDVFMDLFMWLKTTPDLFVATYTLFMPLLTQHVFFELYPQLLDSILWDVLHQQAPFAEREQLTRLKVVQEYIVFAVYTQQIPQEAYERMTRDALHKTAQNTSLLEWEAKTFTRMNGGHDLKMLRPDVVKTLLKELAG